MKNIQISVVGILLFVLSFSIVGFSQDSVTDELKFEVNRVYPFIVINKTELSKIKTLTELNRNYKSSWVKSFISVEVAAVHNGIVLKSIGVNDTLNQEQIDLMIMSDIGSSIFITVNYMPDNTMTTNEPKVFDFEFTIDPENEAFSPGGIENLENYLKENAIDKIPSTSFNGYDMKAVKFTVSEEGVILDVKVFGSEYQTKSNDDIENILLNAVRKMPCWIPAEYADGTKVKQEFVLTVGNMENCMVNLLNIHKEGQPNSDKSL